MSAKRRSLADMLRETWETDANGPHSKLEVVFEFEPPPLSVFVKDKRYLAQGDLSLSFPQYDFVRHFEQVLHPETYIAMVEEFGEYWMPVRFVHDLTAQWGKGAGKDHVCQVSFARIANLLLSLHSPQDYYGRTSQTIIHMMNVAKSSAQAQGVFFKPLRDLLTRSPFFADQFESDIKPGPAAGEVKFKKRVELISGHSDAEGLEGKNLIAAIADEISAFPTVNEARTNRTGRVPVKTAEGILEMLESSASTRFPFHYKLAKISYPRYKGDAIQQATAVAKEDVQELGEESTYYFSGPLTTWDVNPLYDKIPRVEVLGVDHPIPDIKKIVRDYRKRPAYARAKYECDPQLSADPVFEDIDAIRAAFSKSRRKDEPMHLEYYWGVEEQTDWGKAAAGELKELPGWQVRFNFARDVIPMAGALYAIHGDMAITGDAAGVCMTHVRNWERREWDDVEGLREENRPIVKVDFLTSFMADKGAVTPDGKAVAREVQIRWYRKLIFELIRRGFAIGSATFDNFQSADTIQVLNSRGIEAKRLSTDTNNQAWETLRDVMYEGRLEGYDTTPPEHDPKVVTELRELTYLPNGKVDHRPDGSKDEADALAGAVTGALELGGDETDRPEPLDFESINRAMVISPPKIDSSWGLGTGGWGLEGMDYGPSSRF